MGRRSAFLIANSGAFLFAALAGVAGLGLAWAQRSAASAPPQPQARGAASPQQQTSAGAQLTSETASASGATSATQGRRGARGRRNNLAMQMGAPPARKYALDPTPGSALVARLDFDRFKSNIKKLASFKTRYWNTQGNEDARNWIESELRSYGYTTERVKFVPTARGRQGRGAKEIDSIFATKVGTTRPQECYIVSGHMDSFNITTGLDQSFAPGANDDGSGTSIVMEMARAFSSPDVKTDVSIRFCLWNCEEIGLEGAKAYVEQRQKLQGIENPPGSGKYPEPKWLGVIQHDMMLFDHGTPNASDGTTVTQRQIREADVDIEYDAANTANGGAISLAAQLLKANARYATDYPAEVGQFMQNTDSTPFMTICPAISLRENERRNEIGHWSDPQWHHPTDVYETYSDADFRLGFNAMQMTAGALADLTGLKPLQTK